MANRLKMVRLDKITLVRKGKAIAKHPDLRSGVIEVVKSNTLEYDAAHVQPSYNLIGVANKLDNPVDVKKAVSTSVGGTRVLEDAANGSVDAMDRIIQILNNLSHEDRDRLLLDLPIRIKNQLTLSNPGTSGQVVMKSSRGVDDLGNPLSAFDKKFAELMAPSVQKSYAGDVEKKDDNWPLIPLVRTNTGRWG